MIALNINILDIAIRKGIFWPSFEIYGKIQGFCTYGPTGSLLKINIERFIRDYYLKREGCMLIEAPSLIPEEVWFVSNYRGDFKDRLIRCKRCGKFYILDQLINENISKKVKPSPQEMYKFIIKKGVKCPRCSSKLITIFAHNLTFKTFISEESDLKGIMRPETAQTTYMSFKRLYQMANRKLPFGVIQFGKSFRNEAIPSIIRLREFTQAEAQFFVDPEKKKKHQGFDGIKNLKVPVVIGKDKNGAINPVKMKLGNLVKNELTNEWVAYYIGVCFKLFEGMGIKCEKLVCRKKPEIFYSNDLWDVEYMSDSIGKIELVAIADRGDYDLKRHMKLSGIDMRVKEGGRKFVPHVIEVAHGVDRALLSVIESCLKKNKSGGFYFSFPPSISPSQHFR